MRKHTRRQQSSGDVSKGLLSAQRATGFLPDTTTPPSPKPSSLWKSKTDKGLQLSIESHITIFPLVELSRKRISLLLEQEVVRVASEGISLEDYFAFEWMLNYLIGSQGIHEVNGKKMSTVVFCANLILLAYRGTETYLYQKNNILPELKVFIEENFGRLSDRKYRGRSSIYLREKFLGVKIEDVDSYFERKPGSVRYSAYCKGYGEGGRSVRKQKTRYSFELDRDDSEQPPEEKFSFWQEIHWQEDLFEIEQLIRINKKKA